MLRVCSLGLLVGFILLGASSLRTRMKRPTESAPPVEWQQRLHRHLTAAQTILAEHDDFSPVAVYVRPDGKEAVELLSFSPEARQRAIAAVTHNARDRNCRGLIFVGDSWTAPPVRGRRPEVGDAMKHPQREECLLLLLFTPDDSWGRTVRYRREGKKIIFEPPDEWFSPDSPWNPWEQ